MLRAKKNALAHTLAVSFLSCPAKTFQNGAEIQLGRSVLEHCQIVGEVAREIVSRYPNALQTSLFPLNAAFAAACHDIGKVSPYFLSKLTKSCPVEALPPQLAALNPELEKSWGGHAGVSQIAAKAMGAPEFIPEILGQHHGFSPPVAGRRAEDEDFGGPAWQREREGLVVALKAQLKMDWPQVTSVAQARLLAGITSVADWIGSGQFFEDPAAPWRESISRALDDAGFVSPSYQPGLTFEQVFGFSALPAQVRLIEQATAPGVYVLEAPMGLGKTEAALYAAYQVLASGQACGIYFALPTQLTSNKIYERFNNFLAAILTPDCRHRSLLLHSNAWLLEETEMGEEGRPGGAWFNHAKRGLLAPFAVGTIDQALMAAMNVKHGFVRAFGLAGKVVILDEVHTYDAYTGTLLDAAVELLRSLHCTVIILSATLNRERREQLLGETLTSDTYPLITAATSGAPLVELPVASSASHRVAIRILEQDKEAITEVLERASQGQQVLWIENTVGEAQQRYLDLAARANDLGLACGLLHSRFTADDRQRIEGRWVNLFGKPGWNERRQQGRILVGTQVLEQSLDIDADFLVSRFAPSDMLLQRMGRLWRHADTPRVDGACCEAWLLAPDLELAVANPRQAFSSSASVYSSYVLCRSLEVWQGLNEIKLPEDIRSLIGQTYALRSEEGDMARWLDELDNGTRWRTGRKAMRQLARVTLAQAGNTLPESKAQTRYSDMESCEVLLLRNIEQLPEGQIRLTLLDGHQVLLARDRNSLNRSEWRQRSALLMRQVVRVPLADAPVQVPIDTLAKAGLQHCFYLGNHQQEEAVLRVALLNESGALRALQGVRIHEKHELEYRDDLGYRVIKG